MPIAKVSKHPKSKARKIRHVAKKPAAQKPPVIAKTEQPMEALPPV